MTLMLIMDDQVAPSSLQDASSDVASIWQDALLKYSHSTGKDIQSLPRYTNVNDILKDGEIQNGVFSTYRHDGSIVQRLRSSIIRSNGIIQSGAQVLGAATQGVSLRHTCSDAGVLRAQDPALTDLSAEYRNHDGFLVHP